MKISVCINTQKVQKDGTCAARLRFNDNENGKNQICYTSLGVSGAKDEFDKQTELFTLTNGATRERNRRANVIISKELDRAERLLFNLEMDDNRNITPATFKEIFEGKNVKQGKISFLDFYLEFAHDKTAKRTKEIYLATYNKIKKYYKKELKFEDIDYTFLRDFEKKCGENGNKINTIAIDLRNIRATYHEATRKKIVSKDLYPFDDYKIKKEETAHRNLTVEQLRKVFSFEGTEAENYARDVSKLIFLLIGINGADLYDLQQPNGERIEYRRHKTGRIYSIGIQKEMEPLFERFKGREKFLCFSEQYKTCKDFLEKVNGSDITRGARRYLKRGLLTIGRETGVGKLTTYVMRHTWATLAGQLDIPKETIAQALGHGKKNTTDIYVSFDNRKIDEANRKVIDYVF
jgi:integrase